MMRRLWRWLVGNPEPDRLQALVEILIESQQRTQQATLNAIATISNSAEAQAKVLAEYLKLFQTPGEPTSRTFDPDVVDEDANKEELAKMGFPVAGTEKEQADWVLKNIDRM